MKLTPEATAALERLRRVENGEEMVQVYRPMFTKEDRDRWGQRALDCCMVDLRDNDRWTVSREMQRLFPPGHDAEITPERLKACGFTPHADARHVLVNPPGHGDSLAFTPSYGLWSLPGEDRRLQSEVAPTNMGEVWQLMAKCGIEVKHV